jgi:hypothetical protein
VIPLRAVEWTGRVDCTNGRSPRAPAPACRGVERRLCEAYGGASEGGGHREAAVGAERVHGFPNVSCNGGRADGGVAIRPWKWGCLPLKQPPRRQEEAGTYPAPSPLTRTPTDACFPQPLYGLAVLNCQVG